MTNFKRSRYALLVIGAILVVGTTLGAGGQMAGWWSSGEPLPNEQAIHASFNKPEMDPDTGLPTGRQLSDRVDFDRARTVAQEPGVALVAVPLKAGGYCLTPSVNGDSDAAIVCDEDASGETDVFVSWANTRGEKPVWVITGRIADPDITAMSLFGLQLDVQEGGFFMATVPQDRWGELSEATGVLELFNSGGDRIRENCVELGKSPKATSPGGVTLSPTDLDTAPPCKA